MTATARPRRNVVVIVMGVVLALCLAAGVGCAASQPYLVSNPLPFGYVVTFCGVTTATPRFQMGVGWASPYFSAALPPFGGPGAGCVTVPWLPILPQRGSLLIP